MIIDRILNQSPNPNNLRIIKTARSFIAINEAARNGFRPLLKKVEPQQKIRAKYAIWQNDKTGEITVHSDFRSGFKIGPGMTQVIDWTFYYPNPFDNPYAAYLVPKNLEIGERVVLEDLIEDIIETTWNQGDASRLKSAEAIWTGSDFEVQFSSNDARYLIG